MKKFLYFLLFILTVLLIYTKREEITNGIIEKKETLKFEEPNEYFKPYDYNFVQNTENLYPENKQDLLNILYTVLNRGNETITFLCGYEDCIRDINEIAEDKETLSGINNLVHPYNSYKNIYFTISKLGKIELNIKKQYSESEIISINNKIDQISNELRLASLNDYDRIKAIHDYIINNTKYDSEINIENQLTIDTNSNKATGLLFDNKAICSGYSDTLAIFLNKYGYNNYKISSEEHIWNLIYINNSWKHIDATWDDPVTSDGRDILIHDFFIVNTNELFEKENELEENDHNFNTSIYQEASSL
jgi:sporulation protein YlmC with PRC-barrel domain